MKESTWWYEEGSYIESMMKVRHSEKLGVELMCHILCVQDPPAIMGRAVYTKLVCKIQLLCRCLLVDRADKECNTLAPPPTPHCGGWQECPDSEQEHHLMYNWSQWWSGDSGQQGSVPIIHLLTLSITSTLPGSWGTLLSTEDVCLCVLRSMSSSSWMQPQASVIILVTQHNEEALCYVTQGY